MKLLLATLAAGLLAVRDPVAANPGGSGTKLKGAYLEARTCDVYTGPCFANSETAEAGKEATCAWQFTEGEWSGADLKGLCAVIVIQASRTIGDTYHSPLPVRNVLFLDEKANDAQLAAMRDFVAKQLGDLAGNVIEERLVPIELKIDCCDKKGCAKLKAGDVVKIETRCLCDKDEVCGNESEFYPPLVKLTDKLSAFTVEHQVKQTLLFHEWTDRESRSAFIGKFEADAPAAATTVNPDEVRQVRAR